MPTACPVCGSNETRLKETISATDAASYFVDTLDLGAVRQLAATIGELWGRPFAEQRDCTQCGFGFTDPFIAGNAEFYNALYGTHGYPKKKWEFVKTIDVLRATGAGRGNAVEIGCGMGYFLDLVAQDIYPKSQLVGLDYNVDGLQRLRERGFSTGTPDLNALPENAYESVFMFQVLEHQDSLGATFANLHRILKPGGSIFIAVPNPELIAFNTAHGSLPDVPPNHIGRWNNRAFEIMAERSGLRLKAFEVEPFSLRNAVLMDLRYSYIQQARRGKGIASMLYGSRRTSAGKVLNTFAAGVTGVSRLSVWLHLRAQRARLGENNWAHLVKPTT